MTQYQFSDAERSLLERGQMPFAIYQFIDKRVVTLILSDGFCRLFGYEDRAQAYYDMDHDMYRDTHPDDVARVAGAAFRFATEGGKYEVIYRTRHRSGTGYTVVHAQGEHIYTDTGVRLAQVWYMDEGEYAAADHAQEEEALRNSLKSAPQGENFLKASYYDYLTGLPSMTYFFELAEAGRDAILRAGKRPVLLYMDLNGMKFYNRKYGFAEGDKLLRAFSRLLVRYFSSENCSRFGQDHFAVFTDDTDIEAILHRLFEEWQEQNADMPMTVRAGVYQDALEHVSVSMACDRAKLACDSLRSTHVSGINYFNSALLVNLERQQYIIENLDRAIEEKWIRVYYQPIVRAVNGRVCDEEALARWIDPVEGLLSPAAFIPVLENAKLIYKLDLYVVEQVLQKIRTMEAEGLPIVPQSINLSRVDFDACDIVEEIRRRVDEAGIPRDKLTIEITESVVGSDFDFMKEQVRRFQALGFPVWMDDFGSGYSSLDVLQSIEFNLIKFDMRFMQQFEEGDNGKIILTELVKMATALNADTVCEGVETAEQVQFLREIGCSKLQGFYYTPPLSLEKVLERYRTGTQIGFENPEETAYFEAVGRLNLYDLAMISHEDQNSFSNFFNILPMAVLEVRDGKVRIMRSNPSYRDYLLRFFNIRLTDNHREYLSDITGPGTTFMNAVRECCQTGSRAFIDEKMADNSTVHSFVRRLAVNPVTGTVAVAAAVLSIMDADQGATYENIARALAADYFNLFYVNLENDKFIEYSSNVGQEEIAVERHGEDFFNAARRDALSLLHKDDQQAFIAAFTKENIIRSLNERGTFTLTYRFLRGGVPTYVHMKVTRMGLDQKYIIIGVSSIDSQMKQKEALDRLRQERVIYARITALSGDYICLYTVDPDTGKFTEYSANSDYAGLGLDKEGEDFFERTETEAERVICAEDLPYYRERIRRENMMRDIAQKGLFKMRYRLMIDGEPKRVGLRAAIVNESDGDKLIVGVYRIEE